MSQASSIWINWWAYWSAKSGSFGDRDFRVGVELGADVRHVALGLQQVEAGQVESPVRSVP